MEVRARYALMGLFTLAVILAGFVFVYWLDTGGGLSKRTTYRIYYDSPVAGLLEGSTVLFNGVRVGEVTSMTLDPAKPSDVVVQISVDRTAPVRSDTVAGIDFQGLAGAPAVSLVGGSAVLPLLSERDEAERTLKAEHNAGQSLAQAGRDVLRNIDSVVGDNAKSLHNAIASIDTFSAALARNSDKVDGILAGLERLTGGGAKPVTRVYDIVAPDSFPPLKSIPKAQLLVPEPRTLANFESDKILVTGGEKQNIQGAQWPDVIPRLIQSRVVQSFENAGYLSVLAGAVEDKHADFVLQLELRKFQIAAGPEPGADIEMTAKILDKDGVITWVKPLKAHVPAKSIEPAAAVAALNEAFAAVAKELVVWVCSVI